MQANVRPERPMTTRFFPRDEYFMRLALREAERSLEHDDVPVGCVIAHEGEVIAAAPNERELRGDPTAHCEVLALREASRRLGSWRLSGAVLYVTLEPCAMCAGAIVLARVPRVIYGAAASTSPSCAITHPTGTSSCSTERSASRNARRMKYSSRGKNREVIRPSNWASAPRPELR